MRATADPNWPESKFLCHFVTLIKCVTQKAPFLPFGIKKLVYLDMTMAFKTAKDGNVSLIKRHLGGPYLGVTWGV